MQKSELETTFIFSKLQMSLFFNVYETNRIEVIAIAEKGYFDQPIFDSNDSPEKWERFLKHLDTLPRDGVVNWEEYDEDY